MGMFLVSLGNMVSRIFIIVLYLVWLFRVSPALTAFIVVTVAVTGFLSLPVGRKKREYEDQSSQVWRKSQYITERTGDFTMAKDIRLYSMQSWLSEMLDKYMGIRLHYNMLSIRNAGIWNVIRIVLVRMQNLGVYGYLIYQVLHGQMAASDLVLYAGMVGTLSQNMIDVSHNISQIYHVSLSFDRVQSFLDYGENLCQEQLPLHTEKIMLELEHVSYHFPGQQEDVLHDLSFTASTGDKIAIVGINGAGKTTLMKLVCGLLEPTKGRILLNGQDMKEMSPQERYSWYSCAFQDIRFLPLSVQENIALCPGEQADKRRVRECLRKAGMLEQIEKLPQGIDSLMEKDINENAVEFSGGERQRLLLAKALYRDTSVLILDEPTAALDPLAENEMYQNYARFTQNKLSFFVSHRLSSTSFCNRILLINQGCIEETGTHEELLQQNGLYAEMFTLQGHYYQSAGGQQEPTESYSMRGEVK